MIYSSLVSTCKPPFKKRCDSMNELKVFGGGIVPISRPANIRVSSPAIAPYPALGFNVFLKKSFNTVTGNISNNASPYSAKSFISLVFHCYNHYCFPFSSTPDRTPFSFASNIGLINFYQARKLSPALKNHGLPKLMKNAPGRFITSKTKNSLKSFCATSILLRHQPPSRPEPDLKRDARILKYCTSLHRCLMIAGCAHEKTTRHLPILILAALWAGKAFSPSYISQKFGTGGFRAKFLLKFQYCFGVVFHLNTLPLVLL